MFLFVANADLFGYLIFEDAKIFLLNVWLFLWLIITCFPMCWGASSLMSLMPGIIGVLGFPTSDLLFKMTQPRLIEPWFTRCSWILQFWVVYFILSFIILMLQSANGFFTINCLLLYNSYCHVTCFWHFWKLKKKTTLGFVF